jgi:hypothetical protein
MNPTQIQTGQTDRDLSPVHIHSANFYVPLVLTTAAAVFGGTLWAREAITAPQLDGWFIVWAGAILIALAAESIGNYLSREAEKAMLDNQAAGSLRLGAYLIGFTVAALAYAHFTTALDKPNTVAVLFALFSAMNPILWSVRAKSRHRELERLRGNVDVRTPKLGSGRKLYHPIKSFKAVRWATWAGETNAQRAVDGWEKSRQQITDRPQTEPIRVEISTERPAQITEPVTERIQIAPGQTAERAQIEAPVETEQITERDAEEVTETVTETVTRTATRTTVSRQERKIERLRERVLAVQTEYPEWETEQIGYAEIKKVTGLSGPEVIKPIYAALYRSETEEYAIIRNG